MMVCATWIREHSIVPYDALEKNKRGVKNDDGVRKNNGYMQIRINLEMDREKKRQM